MKRCKQGTPKRTALRVEELEAIVERASAVLSTEERDALKAAIDTLAFLTRELEAKGASIARLRKLLFGASTEKTRTVVGETAPAQPSGSSSGAHGASEAGAQDSAGGNGSGRGKGHGRNGSAAYVGAEKVAVAHQSLHHGDHCPGCLRGKVYTQAEPAVLVRVVGMAPLQATVYERERLRCNLCGDVFTARALEGVGEEKYDETVAAMIGLLRYGCGLPFNRLERLQCNLGIPLPAATQWELVRDAAGLLVPAYDELVRQAAQGEVVYNDDTTAKILELGGQSRQEALAGEEQERTGVFTSGIVSTVEGHQIALFFTGRKHAGENLQEVLKQRARELSAPIQMCDALSRNTAGEFDTILAHCNAHARRRFVDVAHSFPDECRHVLETLREVYRNDALARQQKMSPAERLRFHQAESGPLMEGLERWMRAQLDEHKVEPNSGLGEAIAYMLKHWTKLTLFLRVPGAPLDNNICERALKKAILHRRNSLFYKTKNGARVGDLFMSLIHTAELCKIDPFGYLVALQRHRQAVADNPAAWLPWNYRDTLTRLTTDPDDSG